MSAPHRSVSLSGAAGGVGLLDAVGDTPLLELARIGARRARASVFSPRRST